VSGRQHWSIAGVAAAAAAGAFFRLHAIGRESLWLDEGYTAWVIQHPPRQMLRLLAADTSPPLYYLILHGWTALCGDSEAALRSLSAVLGITTIIIVASISHRLHGSAVAAAWLLAFSWPAVAYCQEARSYEMSAFLAALILYAVVRHLQRPHGVWLIATLLAVTAGLYVNNFMILYAIAIALAAFFLPSEMTFRRRLRDGLHIASGVAILYLPWIGPLIGQTHRVQRDFWIDRPTLDSVCQVLARCCGVDHFWTWDRYLHGLLTDTGTDVPRLAAAGLLVAALILARRRAGYALAIAILFPPLAAAALSLGPRSIFLPAAFLPSIALTPILFSIAAPARCGRFLIAGLLVLSAVNLWAYENERTKEDWRGAAAAVAEMPAVPHRLIVFVASEAQLPFDYYYRLRPGESETGSPDGFFDADPPRTQLRVLRDSDLAALRRRISLGGFDDLVLIVSHAGWLDTTGRLQPGYSDPQGLTARYLLGALRELERIDFSDQGAGREITIWRLQRSG
jgi:hypothetical protein